MLSAPGIRILVNPYRWVVRLLLVRGFQENRNTLQKSDYSIFLPRVGFAWSIRNDTVVRGGYGQYAYNYSEDTYDPNNLIGKGSPLPVPATALSLTRSMEQARNHLFRSPRAQLPLVPCFITS